MKKITIILAGLALSAAANANERDLSQKFYAGVNVGGSFATLSSPAKKLQTATNTRFSKQALSGDVHFGKRFGAFGVELNAGLLDQLKFAEASGLVTAKAVDYLISVDLGYYVPVTDMLSVKAVVGLGGMYTQNTITITGAGSALQLATQLAVAGFNSSDNLLGYSSSNISTLAIGKNTNTQFKLTPKVGAGLVYAVHQNVSLNLAANFICPIKADNIKYLFNTNVGVNYHF